MIRSLNITYNVHRYAQLPLQGLYVSDYPQGKKMNQHEQPIGPAIAYTGCWQLVFIYFCLVINLLILFFQVIINLHQPIHEAQIYFVFFERGQS
jgi:hypothetical protein